MQISTNRTMVSGRGVSREKSRFQVGYIPRIVKERRWRLWQTATEEPGSARARRKRRCRISWSRAIRAKEMELADTADLQGEKMPPPRDYLVAR